eukprot:gene47309-38102_t
MAADAAQSRGIGAVDKGMCVIETMRLNFTQSSSNQHTDACTA